MRILVAEDNAFNRVFLREMLSRLGVESKIVDDGAEALEAFRAEHFDIVLMDLQMPRMDGFEAGRQIRELIKVLTPGIGEGRGVRVIALTADTSNLRAREGLFDDVLVKPIQKSDLIKILGTGFAPGLSHENPDKASSGTEILDRVYGLRAAGGVWSQFVVLVQLFLQYTPALLSSLNGSVQGKSYEESALRAHSLQGSAASIGALRLASAAGKLTQAARSRAGWAEVVALRETVDSHWLEVKGMLDGLLNEH